MCFGVFGKLVPFRFFSLIVAGTFGVFFSRCFTRHISRIRCRISRLCGAYTFCPSTVYLTTFFTRGSIHSLVHFSLAISAHIFLVIHFFCHVSLSIYALIFPLQFSPNFSLSLVHSSLTFHRQLLLATPPSLYPPSSSPRSFSLPSSAI